LSTPPVRRGAGRLGFAVVAFGLVIREPPLQKSWPLYQLT
jgi:hypothetical protein